jgi:hypothetical protein
MNSRTILFFLVLCISHVAFSLAPGRDYYLIRIYHVKDAQKEKEVESYLKGAYLPALHRAGISKVGVFKPIESDTALYGKRIFVLIPFSSAEEFANLDSKLQKDNQYQAAAGTYWTAPYDNPPYARIESILAKAFVDAPKFQLPVLNGPLTDRIYELRSYEGPTEKIFANKVQMFNAGDEIGLFKKLGFNAVFYSEVLSGSRMPNLMYMTSFNNMTSHDEHWKAFVDSPEWKKLSAMPEYQHNVSHIDKFLLHPTEYSDI